MLLPFFFIAAGFTQLTLLNGFRWEYGAAIAVWSAVFWGIAALLRVRLPAADPFLLPLTALLTGLGLLMVARLAPNFLVRQLVWLVVSGCALLAVTLIPRSFAWLRQYKYTWLLAGLGLLAATLIFGVNPSGYGARLWLGFGGMYFQPSEPLKILLVVFLAVYLSDRRRQMIDVEAKIGRLAMPHPAYFGPMLLMWGFSVLLLFWQRDLGAALLFFCTFLAMLYVAVGQKRYLLIGGGLLLTAVVIGYRMFDYVALRVESWWNPWLDPAGRSFQIAQSLLAFAAGGWFGQGLGQGLPTAIPVVHTDFVFAAIAEEYGLLGALATLAFFGLIVQRAFFIAWHCRTHFQQLLATGLGFMIGLQVFVIAGGALKLIPLTGVTLPLVSYGGSSLLTSLVMIGLLLFLSTRTTLSPPATYAVEPEPESK